MIKESCASCGKPQEGFHTYVSIGNGASVQLCTTQYREAPDQFGLYRHQRRMIACVGRQGYGFSEYVDKVGYLFDPLEPILPGFIFQDTKTLVYSLTDAGHKVLDAMEAS